MKSKHIVITTGGTGGHIFPAKSTAFSLTKKGYKVTIFADKKYHDYHQDDDPYSFRVIGSSQVNRNIFLLIKAALKISFGIFWSFLLFLWYRPKIVVAFGGYATFPTLISAVILRKTIILHEQNAHLGKINRIFAKYAKIIALTYKKTSGVDKRDVKKTKYTGNPIRKEIAALNKKEYQLPSFESGKRENNLGYDVLLASDFVNKKDPDSKENMFNVLVIGGSGGAKIFSDVLPKAFFNIRNDLKNNINIIQQCRKELMEYTYGQYKNFNLNLIIRTFFEDIEQQIEKAHLIIARAGSSSIAEFTAAKKPLILIPFAKAADNHQEKNAEFLEKSGAAIVLKESQFTINKVSRHIEKLIDNPKLLVKMSNSSSACCQIKATDNLIKVICGETKK